MAPRKPASDAAYLEAAARIIFMSGLNRGVVDAKWPAFRQAFFGFDVPKVAALTPADVDRMAGDERLIRYHAKLAAVVQDAEEMLALAADYGSFGAYVDCLLESAGLTTACSTLAEHFAYISKAGALHWLFATGHDVGDIGDRARAKYAPFQG